MKPIPLSRLKKGVTPITVALLILISLSIAISFDLSAITTKTASGLVTDYFVGPELYVDNDFIVVSDSMNGISYIRTEDVNNPRGKVHNYRGRDSSNAVDRFGCSGIAKRASDGKIYAWYGRDIVDVINKQIVYSNAPDYTHGHFGISPKERFVIDNAGNFWIGTENLDEAGNILPGSSADSNGLYRITSDFSARELVLPDAIWNIFKDSAGTIWISSNAGVYRKVAASAPTLVYNSITSNRFADHILEFNGEIYAFMKNFFHYPYGTPTRIFELFKWDGSTFTKECDFMSNSIILSAFGFVYNNTLFVRNMGGNSLYQYNLGTKSFSLSQQDLGSDMGLHRIIAFGNTVVSVGNMAGISLYNFNSDAKTLRLTTANTTEGLVGDHVQSLYVSQSTNRVMVGIERSNGFNAVVNNTFGIYELPNEVSTVGFFEHQGRLYVQGAVNLYQLDSGQVIFVKNFYTNGEKIYYDSRGYLWTFPNWGAGYGGIGVLNLQTMTVKGTPNYGGDVSWTLDQSYHFNDVISIPGEAAVFIAVSDSEVNGYSPIKMPFVLKYDYSSNTFSKVNLPDSDCQGIRTFASDGTYIYGVSRQKLYRYQGGTWQFYCSIQLGNDFRGTAIAEDFLFIISGWNSNGSGKSGGLEVVDLRTKTSSHYNSSVIPLPSDAVFAVATEKTGDHDYRLWLGTSNGLSSCDLTNIRQ